MSGIGYYYSEDSNSSSAPSSVNEYQYEETTDYYYEPEAEELNYQYYDNSESSNEATDLIVEAESVPAVVPRAARIVWTKPQSDHIVVSSRKRPYPKETLSEEAPPPLIYQGYSNMLSPEGLLHASRFPSYLDKVHNTFVSQPRAPKKTLPLKGLTARLEKNPACDVHERRCLVPSCGRKFVSLDILAFHVAYAHQQQESTSNGLSTCIICGLSFKNYKGRFAHLLSAHKDLRIQHQRICLVQRPIPLEIC